MFDDVFEFLDVVWLVVRYEYVDCWGGKVDDLFVVF